MPPSEFKENAEDLNTAESVQVDRYAVRVEPAELAAIRERTASDFVTDPASVCGELAAELMQARLDRRALLSALDVELDEYATAAPEMPRPPAEEAPTEYLCPRCERWALWTDGETDSDSGVWTFWCQTCSAETPLESMDSRPQKAASGPETPGTGSGRGTGVAEAPGTAPPREEWGVRRRDGRVLSFENRDDAEAFADGWRGGERTVVHRFIGAWEPAPSLPVPSTEKGPADER